MGGVYDDSSRYLRKAEEEERWREQANDTEQWKQITKVAVQQSDNRPASPSATKWKLEGEQDSVFKDVL